MLLWENGEHLCLNGLHLVIELLEARHLASVPMYLGLQRSVAHLDQCHVNIERLMPRWQKLVEVIIVIPPDMRVSYLGAV